MTGDFDRRIVGQFEIEELDPEVGKSLFGLRQNARVAFSSNMVEGHLNASFHGKGMAVFLAEAGSLVFGEVGEPADSKRSDRFNVVVENKMRGLVVIAIEDEEGEMPCSWTKQMLLRIIASRTCSGVVATWHRRFGYFVTIGLPRYRVIPVQAHNEASAKDKDFRGYFKNDEPHSSYRQADCVMCRSRQAIRRRSLCHRRLR